MKKLIKFLLPLGLTSATIVASCQAAVEVKTENKEEKSEKPSMNVEAVKAKRNSDLDFSQYGIQKFDGKVKDRVLLFPAQSGSNNLDSNGVFHIKLHLKPVEGVTGEWIAFATEVKSANDNTLVEPLVIKQASTIANPDVEYKLSWSFPAGELKDGKSYTFMFWKKDGSERILFSKDHMEYNQDIFPARMPN